MKKLPELTQRIISALLFGVIFWSIFLLCPAYYFSFFLVFIMVIILMFEWPQFNFYQSWYTLTTIVYPVAPFLALIYLNQHPAYRPLLWYVFILAFAHDTGSYFIGKTFGKHKLMPSVSPGKTWEGAFGGFICTCIAAASLAYLTAVYLPIMFLVTFSLVVSSVALTGDLFESWLKRKAGIKDAGVLMPGHGGLLDRFDSILFLALFFYSCKNYLVSSLFT